MNKQNKQLWDIWKNSKYRVDFTYQTKHGFVWRETIDLLDNKYDAKEFIFNVYYNPCFPIKEEEIIQLFKGFDAIKVDIVEIATDKIISSILWRYK